MYTSRTPYPGKQPIAEQDKKLEKTLTRMLRPQSESEKSFINRLQKDGKLPAKNNMDRFLQELRHNSHFTDDEDAELITRFEMQQSCPDILITNYSMLEYMLLRLQEKKIWDDTKEWLTANDDNKLLFIIDEAHMYRGAAGGEVALLIRRFLHKLGISRDRVQFILTTASMPNNSQQDADTVIKFAKDLTASDGAAMPRYLIGRRESFHDCFKYDIPIDIILQTNPSGFEDKDEQKLSALLVFWSNIAGFDHKLNSLDAICHWMYDNLVYYRPFYQIIKQCRGNAVSFKELATSVFENEKENDAIKAISVLLAIASLAKNENGSVLFPARMHMLFKGIDGVYACANSKCSKSYSVGGLTLGEIYLSDGNLLCRHCGSVVYELYNDRRCGALFFKGYILEKDCENLRDNVYLWRHPGQRIDQRMKEIHLFIPTDDFNIQTKQSKNQLKPCYLDIRSGFVNFRDDSLVEKPWAKKLYYCNYMKKGRPQIITFPTCPHCRRMFSSSQLTSFSTRGDQSFFSLIKSQFQNQPAVSGKDSDPDRLPNMGRKVLLFSDSRQRAAKLARDMSNASDISAARQLFALASSYMEIKNKEWSLDYIYDFFCIAAAQKKVMMFHGDERKTFINHCAGALKRYKRCTEEHYEPGYSVVDHAPGQFKEHFIRLIAGGYNTIYDSAIGWIEPMDRNYKDACSDLAENNITVGKGEFLEIFNAWIMSICDDHVAIGHKIEDLVRLKVRMNYTHYGLDEGWKFSDNICKIMGWKDASEQERIWKRVLKDNFLEKTKDGRLCIDISRVKIRFDKAHNWFKCERCSEVTPFLLKNKCHNCGSDHIHVMEMAEYEALSWRKSIYDALNGEPIQVINTEEHTAQLSHKDQRNDLWSKTEQYELRFLDLVQEDETPVDILSCTTTMEVGIDIGSLTAIGLRNVPPMRENYQQRAGRAGRRGSSLSTVVTFCDGNPHDMLYFNNPEPMFRGDPRKPFIDIHSTKLLQRHMAMVILQEFLNSSSEGLSLDTVSAESFLKEHIGSFERYLSEYDFKYSGLLLPATVGFDYNLFIKDIKSAFDKLKNKLKTHPELFKEGRDAKVLLDALYEEGIIPTYSFPKNVISLYIQDNEGKITHEVDRGLDIAIGEYAPGRAIVVDKKTYQVGGLYYPGREWQKPAKCYTGDPNYVKPMHVCSECGWFGLKEENVQYCPFCGNQELTDTIPMLRPWGFAPKNAQSVEEVQLSEEYTFVQPPLYSTLSGSDDMTQVSGLKNIRIALRANQRIIMLNRGANNQGFCVCRDCGAAMPGNDLSALQGIRRPYKLNFNAKECLHNYFNVNLGFDFITDMLVFEIALDNNEIDTRRNNNPWLNHAAQSFAEAFRLAVCKKLDVEFTELVTGYRIRPRAEISYVDIYLYDSLSSGAGYAVSIKDDIKDLLFDTEELLKSCNCETACSKCLKHYRNQYVHGLLNRQAALELLDYGRYGVKASPFELDEQWKMLSALENILEQYEFELEYSEREILIKSGNAKKRVIIYPAMWAEPREDNTIYVNDADVKYAKPYAIEKIRAAF